MRYLLRLLACCCVLAAARPAVAAELRVHGEFQAHADWNGYGLGSTPQGSPGNVIAFQSSDDAPGGPHPDVFEVQQRLRAVFVFAADDNLKAVWGVEVGTGFWGQSSGPAGNNLGSSSGFGPDGDGVNAETRWAYLDFTVPGSMVNVKAGLLPLTFPTAFGASAVTDMDAPGIVVSAPLTDTVGLTAAWSRLIDLNTGSTGWDAAGTRVLDEMDVILLALPVTPPGLTVVPWGAYAWIGRGLGEPTLATSGSNITSPAGFPADLVASTSLGLLAPADFSAGGSSETTVWWAGLAVTVTALDPFEIAADFNYGRERNKGWGIDRKGWLADARVSYKGLPFGTLTVFGLYSTGENDAAMTPASTRAGDGTSERMPFLLEDWSFPGGFWHGGSSFDAQNGHGSDLGGYSNSVGTWTAGFGLYGVSFLENLRHDLILAYIRGTNSTSSIPMLRAQGYGFGSALAWGDSIWEIDLNHSYDIYEGLQAIVETGYMIPHHHLPPSDWGITGTSDAWRVLAGFKYEF